MKKFLKGMKWYDIVVCVFLLQTIILNLAIGYYIHAFYFSMLLFYIAMFLDVCSDRDNWKVLAKDCLDLLKVVRDRKDQIELENFVLSAKLNKETYLIVIKKNENSTEEKGIWCLHCHQTSWNENDVEKKYCGNCHIFHKDPKSVKDFQKKQVEKDIENKAIEDAGLVGGGKVITIDIPKVAVKKTVKKHAKKTTKK